MTRTIFGLLTIVFLGMLLSAGAIRYELAAPGLSGLFGNHELGQPGQNYAQTLGFHRISGFLTILLAGMALIASVLPRLSATARIWLWFGFALIVFTVALWGWIYLASVQPANSTSGWVLYPPLSSRETGVLGIQLPPAVFSLFVVWTAESVQLALGTGACLIGTALVARAGGANKDAVTAVVALAVVATILAMGQWINGLGWVAIGVLVLLLVTPRIWAEHAHLVVGLALMIGANHLFAALDDVADPYVAGTAYETAATHMSLSAFALFCVFSALVLWLRPLIHRGLIWAHAVLMGLAVLASFLPLVLLGRRGMPRAYMDYPNVFAFWNLFASIATFALICLILLGVVAILLRRG